MSWKIKDYDKVMAILKDPRKILKSVTLTLKTDKPTGPLTDEGFEISKDLIVAAFRKMRKCNADKIDLSFNDCAKLMGYSVKLTITSPKHKPHILERIAKRFT